MAKARSLLALVIGREASQVVVEVGTDINDFNVVGLYDGRSRFSGGRAGVNQFLTVPSFAEYAFEALGREPTFRQAGGSADVDGRLIFFCLLKSGAKNSINAAPFVDEQSIKGRYFGSSNLRLAVSALCKSYLSGELFLDELISERIGLWELNVAFDRLRKGEGARNVLVFK